jgi:hypothetical protein
MSLPLALVIIAAIIALVSVVRSRHNASLGYGTDENGKPIGNPQREEDLRREIEELRERVQVLERIATDDRTRLAAEIERLRDDT